MQKRFTRKEAGSVEVEATFILPIAILCVFLLLYLSLLLFARANLQASLETCLVYYKNSVTDTFVKRDTEVSYREAEGSRIGKGNSYHIDGALNPYIGMFENTRDVENAEDFKTYFQSVAGNMLFGQKALNLSIQYTNYFLVKEYEVTATQEVTLPLDFSFIGQGNQYVISATARAAVTDHDDTIRNLDYLIDILEDTKLGDYARDLAGKVKEGYEKLRKDLGGT